MNETPNNQDSPARWRIIVAAAPVLLLAFLLASFPARNSDVWRHLATGRALLSGAYTFGVDPFAYTTDGIKWINHSWLWDLVLYLAYQGCGDRVVIVNTLLAIALAAFMLLGAGVAKSPWTAALSVALGLVCIGPHLILSPMVVTYVLFAFTLWWLGRTESWSVRAHIPLFLAFAVWANSSEGFRLGPITVALFWFGGLHRDRRVTGWRGPLVVLAISVAVCFLTPHAFLGGSSGFRPATANSIKEYGGLADLAMTWPAVPIPLIAHALLFVLCFLSIGLNTAAMFRPQTVVLLILLAISSYSSSEIVPFLAVFACPIMAANWRAYLERRGLDHWQPSRRAAWFGRTTAIAALLALAASACPGWLQGSFEPRGWQLRADPAMKRAALQLAVWHQQGKLGAHTRGLSVSVDLAHYIEWFCPEEKIFRDGRTNLFPADVIAEHQQVANALAAEPVDPSAWIEARAILRRWRVTHVEIADATDRRLAAMTRNLMLAPHEWSLVDLQGRATVFAWQTPALGKPLPLPSVDWQRRAFDPRSASTAPRRGIARDPQPRAWWDCVVWSAADDADPDEAIVDLVHFEAMRPAYVEINRRIWEMEAIVAQLGTVVPHGAGIESLAGCYPGALLASSLHPIAAGQATPLDIFTFQVLSAHIQTSDQGPPGSLLLAIRAARRALHDNPDDAIAHLRLGRAYDRLQRQTTERGIAPSFQLLEQLRKIQALVALNRAAQLRPESLSAHEMLANLLLEARGLDLALPHVQAHLRISKAAGPMPNETHDAFVARIDKLADGEQRLGKQVRELLNLVDTKAFKLDAHGKALLAESNGLPGYALEQLLKSNYAEFGTQGAIMELLLLLNTGRTRDFRALIDPDMESKMGSFNYRWLLILLAAADGDYDQADEHLQRLVSSTYDFPDLGLRKARSPDALAAIYGQQMLTGASINPTQPLLQIFSGSPWDAPETQVLFLRRLDGMAQSSRHDADLHALRGVLAVESGAIESAQRAFRASLSMWNGNEPSALLSRHYLGLIAKK